MSEKEVRAQEFSTYAALHFELYIPRREFLPHISRIYADLGAEEEVVVKQKPRFWTRFFLGKATGT